MPHNDGVRLFSNGQGVYVDRTQIAKNTGIAEEKVEVTLVPTGGGFGERRSDGSGHVSLFAYLLKKPVKLVLSRKNPMSHVHPKPSSCVYGISLSDVMKQENSQR